MIVTLLDNVNCTPDRGSCLETKGGDFLDLLADEKGVPSLECSTETDKKNGPGFILADYKKDARSKNLKDLDSKSVTEVFCYDIDEMTLEEVEAALEIWVDYDCLIYSTFKHTPEKPRLRLLVNLSEPVPNFSKEPFQSLYVAGAELLKIKADPGASDRVRLYFGPQHKPGAERERHRFLGKKLDLNEVRASKNERSKKTLGDMEKSVVFSVAKYKPKVKEIKKLITKLRGGNRRSKDIASALAAILREEPFAFKGSRHTTTLNVAFDLCREFPGLDADWFANEYLVGLWQKMWPEGGAAEDWDKAVSTAEAKLESAAKEKEEAKEAQTPKPRNALTGEELNRAMRMRGKLIMSQGSTYYVYDVRCDRYKGPYKAGQLTTVVMKCLEGVPGVDAFEISRSGRIAKPASILNAEYGDTVQNVTYYAKQPSQVWDAETESICSRCYNWITWKPVYHEIADELLHVVAGKHYPLLEAYLTKFRDLDQPLPALTLVGTRGTWKSRICEILSRFWTTRDTHSPGKAAKILARFNEHLLKNPIVWSDEELACTAYGKPQPEAYRESITAKAHAVEPKGAGVVTLVSAVRHMISVNDDTKVFSSEVDSNSIYATMERFLLMYTDAAEVHKLEKKWFGTPEMDRLRSGESLLEHVMWIEKNKKYESCGRLFVQPHTDAKILHRAAFADDRFNYIMRLCIDPIEKAQELFNDERIKRLPMFVDDLGDLRISPKRVHDLWSESPITKFSSVKKPTPHKISSILSEVGIKKDKSEKASKHKLGGFKVDYEVFKQFIDVNDVIDRPYFEQGCLKGFGKSPKDIE